MRQELIFHELHIRPDVIDLYATVSAFDSPIEISDFAIVNVPNEGFCIVQPESDGDLEFLNEYKGEKIVITTNPDHKLPMYELEFLQAYALTVGNITGFINLQTTIGSANCKPYIFINEDNTISIEIGQTSVSIDEIIDKAENIEGDLIKEEEDYESTKSKFEEILRDLVKDNPNIKIISAEEFMAEGSMDLDEALNARILTFEEIVWGIRMNQLTLEDAVDALKKLHDIQLN